VSEFVFAQQSLQPKLSRRRYASVSFALQNNTVFRHAHCRTESVSVMDHEQTMGVNSRVLDQKQQNTSLAVSRCSGAWNCKAM